MSAENFFRSVRRVVLDTATAFAESAYDHLYAAQIRASRASVPTEAAPRPVRGGEETNLRPIGDASLRALVDDTRLRQSMANHPAGRARGRERS